MLFEKTMTYPEALKAFFLAIEGKTPKEIKAIQNEFEKVIPEITKNELSGSSFLTSYTI